MFYDVRNMSDFIKLVWANLTEVKSGAFELNSNWIWTTLVLKWHWITSVIFLECLEWWNIAMCQDLELGRLELTWKKIGMPSLTNFGDLNLNSNGTKKLIWQFITTWICPLHHHAKFQN